MEYRSGVRRIGPAVALRGHMERGGSIFREAGKEKLEKRISVFARDRAAIDPGAIIRVRETDVDWLIQE